MVAVGVAGLLVGGGVTYITNNFAPEETKTVTEMETVTVAPTTEPEIQPGDIGLEQLYEEEDVEYEEEAEFGNRNIGGQSYTDAVTGGVYAAGSGFSELTVFTKGRFSSVQFVVGIDAEASCQRARAFVSIEDQDGQVLWGPVEVGISDPITKTLSIPESLQVIFVQRSAETESACDYGMAQVSWGDVTFQAG